MYNPDDFIDAMATAHAACVICSRNKHNSTDIQNSLDRAVKYLCTANVLYLRDMLQVADRKGFLNTPDT